MTDYSPAQSDYVSPSTFQGEMLVELGRRMGPNQGDAEPRRNVVRMFRLDHAVSLLQLMQDKKDGGVQSGGFLEDRIKKPILFFRKGHGLAPRVVTSNWY